MDDSVMQHNPPFALVRDPSIAEGNPYIECADEKELNAKIQEICQANPGQFVDIYSHRGAARERPVLTSAIRGVIQGGKSR